MNTSLVCRLLGRVALLVGVSMLFSLPWGFTWRDDGLHVETRGVVGLSLSVLISFCVAGLLSWLGRGETGRLYRKEAMAVVGLCWMLATVLGALPFLFSGTSRLAVRDQSGTISDRVPMSFADAIFESASGFSTTGATVIGDLEDRELVPRCILFWRSSTHFLGGLGIIVLFVAILGQGSAGKTLMRSEMPGPSQQGMRARMQHTAWVFTAIYLILNAVLCLLLVLEGMGWFDAICHAFGTLATGGFSTYNASLGHFDSPSIEFTVTVFMILAGSNFALLYAVMAGRWGDLWRDLEWRTYIVVIFGVTALVVAFGLWHDDFVDGTNALAQPEEFFRAIRFGLFQVVSIMTTTGFGTHDFDGWNSFGRGVLFLLMFVGGCAGSTGGGLKVIRHILFLKILKREIERSFRPSVVRPLRIGDQAVNDPEMYRGILVYFSMILVIFVFSWMALVTIEPDSTWNDQEIKNKLIDSASGIAATLNNIGPGLGIVGATQNYAHFTSVAKLLFAWLMMLGRLEIFVVLVLFSPRFWRSA